ncbi:MAG TPA: DUF6305 family protein [Spirochaetia bacterium]|nr:DUF6305 family protein [Spirochaetia bacterium]
MKRALSLNAFVLLAAVAAGAQSWSLKAPIAQKPAFLTSIGQSADIEMVKVLLDRNGIPFKADEGVAAKALAATGAKTLVLAIGGSSKGLGAAGISAEAELERTKALLAEAKRLGMKIIGVHVGGEARRGELSDKFIVAALPSCDYVVIVADGDKDGLFAKLCGSKIPLDKVDKISKAGVPIAAAFVK